MCVGHDKRFEKKIQSLLCTRPGNVVIPRLARPDETLVVRESREHRRSKNLLVQKFDRRKIVDDGYNNSGNVVVPRTHRLMMRSKSQETRG